MAISAYKSAVERGATPARFLASPQRQRGEVGGRRSRTFWAVLRRSGLTKPKWLLSLLQLPPRLCALAGRPSTGQGGL